MGTPDLVSVSVIGLPLDVYRRTSEHTDELLREFALIREDDSEQVPARLLALIDELNARFAVFTAEPTAALRDAATRGDASIDLVYEVPPDASEGVARLGDLLDEADEFCRAGDLLTLASTPEGVAFRRWFLEEFLRQIDGKPPRSWAAFLSGAADGEGG